MHKAIAAAGGLLMLSCSLLAIHRNEWQSSPDRRWLFCSPSYITTYALQNAQLCTVLCRAEASLEAHGVDVSRVRRFYPYALNYEPPTTPCFFVPIPKSQGSCPRIGSMLSSSLSSSARSAHAILVFGRHFYSSSLTSVFLIILQ